MRVRPMPQPRPIFVPHRHFLRQRMAHRFSVIVHQIDVTVGAARESLPVLSSALWTIHSVPSLLQLELPTGPTRGTATVVVRWRGRQIGWQTPIRRTRGIGGMYNRTMLVHTGAMR